MQFLASRMTSLLISLTLHRVTFPHTDLMHILRWALLGLMAPVRWVGGLCTKPILCTNCALSWIRRTCSHSLMSWSSLCLVYCNVFYIGLPLKTIQKLWLVQIYLFIIYEIYLPPISYPMALGGLQHKINAVVFYFGASFSSPE